jgi:hypothetical protein
MRNKQMKTSFVIGVFVLFITGNILLIVNASDETIPNVVWEKTFFGDQQGGSEWNSRRGQAVQQTTDGGYIILGQSKRYRLEGGDVWLLKTDKDGNKEWDSYLPNNPYNDHWGVGLSIQQITDGGYVITTNKNMVIKTDGNGIFQWMKNYSLGTESVTTYPPAVQQTSDGGYIVLSTVPYHESYHYNKTIIIRNCWIEQNGERVPYPDNEYPIGFQYIFSGTRIILCKLNGNGVELWNKTFGAIYEPPKNLTEIYENQNISFMYTLSDPVSSGSNEAGLFVKLSSDGGYLIFTRTGAYADKNTSYSLLITDNNGIELSKNKLDTTVFNTTQFSIISFYQNSDKSFVITGGVISNYWQNQDMFAMKTDSNLNKLWYRTFGGRQKASGFSIQQTTDGGYIIAGGIVEDAGQIPWLVKTDGNGNELWNSTFGSAGSYLTTAIQAKDNGYILVGTSCIGQYCDETEAFLTKLSGTNQGGNQIITDDNNVDNNNDINSSKGTPGFEMVFVLGAIGVALILLRRR